MSINIVGLQLRSVISHLILLCLISICTNRKISDKSLRSLVLTRLPDEKNLALSRLKAFADDNFIEAQAVQFPFDRVENVVGKGENAGYHRRVKSFH